MKNLNRWCLYECRTTFLEDETLEEFNDFAFDLNSMRHDAEAILQEQKELGYLIEGDFESSQWKFISHTRHTTSTFNFKQIEERLLFIEKNPSDVVLSLKCWVASLLPQRSVESLSKYLNYLIDFMEISQVYNPDKIEGIEIYLRHECNDRRAWNACVPTINFLDFYEAIDPDLLYKNILIKIKGEINIKNVSGRVRGLPAAKDVLILSNAVEHFFENEKEPFFLKYYPIKIWWDLSNLIPMRPSEFCAIERDALTKENERYYIRLPRLKQKNNQHRIQIVDKISIPKETYEKIQEYLSWTQHVPSETLISYAPIRKRDTNSPFKNRFRYDNLQALLYEFYEEIIDKRYGNFYKQKIRPGDTRHFAFLNLMRLGYHPVEIARLGGHTSIQAQYHYQQHMEYWVDIEIIEMMQKMKQLQQNENTNKPIDDEFIREKVLKVNDSNFKMELDVGYCTDPNMYCQVEKCYFCDYWRIEQDEFILHRKTIEHEMKQCKSDIERAIKTIKNLYQVAIKEKDPTYFSEQDVPFQKELFYSKNQLDEKLHQYMQFTTKLQGEGNHDH